jgi:hypothetical protein
VTEVPTRRRSRLSPDPIETVRRTWRARYRDETGKEHARHFDRKADAARWLAEVTAAVVTGQYVESEAGRITLERSFRDWSRRQVWVTGTRDAMGLAVKSCTFANVELRVIRPSHVELWVKSMAGRLAPSTVAARFMNVRTVLRAAVRDRPSDLGKQADSAVELYPSRRLISRIVVLRRSTPPALQTTMSSIRAPCRPLR